MRALIMVIVALACLMGPRAAALADDATKQAKAHYATGNKHYELGEYKQALAEYREAYRLKTLPGFLFNIAQCHRKLNQHQQALNMYQSYLTELPEAPNREVVLELIEESKAELEKQRREEQERRRIEAERQAAAKQKLQAERERAERQRALERERREQERQREKLYDRHPTRIWALGGLGAAGVSFGVGALFAVKASDDQSAFRDNGCGDVDRPLTANELTECERLEDSGNRNTLIRNVLLGSGAAIAAASAALLVLDPGNVERPEKLAGAPRLSITPTSVSVSVSW